MEEIKKFVLTGSKNTFKVENIRSQTILKIELIEFEFCTDPNNFWLTILSQGGTSRNFDNIYFYKYRSKMLLQNNKYILDTADNSLFSVNINSEIFLKVEAEEKATTYKITFYYSIISESALPAFL